MAASQKSAKFSVDVEVTRNPGGDAADSLEALRQKVIGSQTSIKDLSATLRNLRGSSDEVKAAKEALKGKIAALKDSVSSASLAINKQGTSLDALNRRHADLGKQAAMAAKAEEEKKKAMGESKDLLETLREKYTAAGGAAGLFAAGSVAVVAAIVAVGAAVGAGVIAFGKWVVASANAARSMSLVRESSLGTKADADALASQMEALAGKVPLARDKLQELGLSIHRAGIGGQTLVDTLAAVALAAAGMDDAAGNQLKALVERGKLTQRFQINPLELQGSGLKLDDVAKQLSSSLGVGIADARKALVEGRVKLGDGAAALRKAVEERFGSTNAKKVLDLDFQMSRFIENVGKLTENVNLEPLLNGFKKIVDLFGEGTVTGNALKTVITLAGNAIGSTFEKAVPLAIQLFKRLVIAGLDVTIMTLKAKRSFEEWFSKSNLAKVDWLAVGLSTAKIMAQQFLITAGAIATVMAASVASAMAQLDLLVGAFKKLSEVSKGLFNFGKGFDAAGMAGTLIDGLVQGLKSGLGKVKSAVTELATGAKQAFKDALGIRSPSKVFSGFGMDISQGVEQGVDKGAPKVNASVERMVEVPELRPVGRAPGGGSPITVNVEINVSGTNGDEVATKIASPDVLGQMTAALERALATAGVPA